MTPIILWIVWANEQIVNNVEVELRILLNFYLIRSDMSHSSLISTYILWFVSKIENMWKHLMLFFGLFRQNSDRYLLSMIVKTISIHLCCNIGPLSHPKQYWILMRLYVWTICALESKKFNLLSLIVEIGTWILFLWSTLLLCSIFWETFTLSHIMWHLMWHQIFRLRDKLYLSYNLFVFNSIYIRYFIIKLKICWLLAKNLWPNIWWQIQTLDWRQRFGSPPQKGSIEKVHTKWKTID